MIINKKDVTPEDKIELVDFLRELADNAAIKMEKSRTLLTFREAAKYLHLKESYLYKLTCYNKIPFHKPNGKIVYFIKEELDKWSVKFRRKKNSYPNTYDEQIKK